MLRALPGGRNRGNKDEAQPPDADMRRKKGADKLAYLAALEKKVLWLSTWMIHNANHIRPSRDGLKVGGHQASSASVATLMTALYLDVMQPQDRVAVKPHAAPVFHALQYLLGRQSRDKLERFRGFGGAQSYPSRTKDGADIVDFSTGSVGLGVGITLFASLVQDYLRLHRMVPTDTPAGSHDRAGRRRRTRRRATSSRRCSKAGSTTCAISGGSSTTTARASTRSCRTACSAGSTRCSKCSAGASSR